MSKVNVYWMLTVLFAFVGMILLFTSSSAFADENNFNTAYKVGGAVGLAVSLFFLYKVSTVANVGGRDT